MNDSGPATPGPEPSAGVVVALVVLAGCATGPLMAGSSEELPSGRRTAQSAADAARQSSGDTVLYATNRHRREQKGDVGGEPEDATPDVGVAETSDANAGEGDEPESAAPDADAGGDAHRTADGETDVAD